MKSVVLVNPRLHRSTSGGVGQPIGLLSVAGVLRKHGYDVRVLDANAYRLSVESTVFEVLLNKPDVVGLTVGTPTVEYVLNVALAIKLAIPSTRIVLGGIHASIFSEELCSLYYVDSVVKGEGELAVLDAVENDGVFERPVVDLNFLPIPAWDLIDLNMYNNYLVGDRFAMLMTSRGCPHNCIFCGASFMCGKKPRYRSTLNVAHELATLRKLRVKWLLFEDDTFTLNKERVSGVCEMLKADKFRWWCNTRVDALDSGLLKNMKASGCDGVCVGVESGNQSILDGLKKGVTLEQIKDGVDLIKACGLKSYGYFMIGNLDDTNTTIRETIDFAKSLPLTFAQFSICTPFPATELYQIAQERGAVGEDVDWSRFDWEAEPPNVSLVSVEERRDWYKRAIREYYFRPRKLLSNLSLKGLKAGWRMIKK